MTFGPIERDDVVLPDQDRHSEVRAAAAAGEPFPAESFAAWHAITRWRHADDYVILTAALDHAVNAVLHLHLERAATPWWHLARRREIRDALRMWLGILVDVDQQRRDLGPPG